MLHCQGAMMDIKDQTHATCTPPTHIVQCMQLHWVLMGTNYALHAEKSPQHLALPCFVGALDCKHMVLARPAMDGSKKRHSRSTGVMPLPLTACRNLSLPWKYSDTREKLLRRLTWDDVAKTRVNLSEPSHAMLMEVAQLQGVQAGLQ